MILAVISHPNIMNKAIKFQMLCGMNDAMTMIRGSLGIVRNTSTTRMIRNPSLSEYPATRPIKVPTGIDIVDTTNAMKRETLVP